MSATYPAERNFRFVDDSDLYGAIACIKQVAEKADITFDQALEVWRLLEQRRATDVHVNDRSIWDEQIAGIAEELERIAAVMHEAMCIQKLVAQGREPI